MKIKSGKLKRLGSELLLSMTTKMMASWLQVMAFFFFFFLNNFIVAYLSDLAISKIIFENNKIECVLMLLMLESVIDI